MQNAAISRNTSQELESFNFPFRLVVGTKIILNFDFFSRLALIYVFKTTHIKLATGKTKIIAQLKKTKIFSCKDTMLLQDTTEDRRKEKQLHVHK